MAGSVRRSRETRKSLWGTLTSDGLRPSGLMRVTLLLATTMVAVSLAQPADAAPIAVAPVAAADKASAADAQDLPKDERPDAVSAQIQAKAIKAPVEVTGDRTESTTTYALPNGAFRQDRASGPVRVQKADDSWVDVDLTLKQGKDGYSPAAAPRPVTFSAGGSGPAAVFEYQGRTLSLLWPDKLPEPTVDGATATYAVSANEDLVLEAKAEGFEQSLVIKKQPAAGDPDPVVSLPLQLDGLDISAAKEPTEKTPGKTVTLTATKAGGYHPEGGKIDAGAAVFAVQQPEMYSAATDTKNGMHTQVRTLKPVVDEGEVPASGPAAKADTAIALPLTAEDKAFLADKDTQYPVTIDPTITAVSSVGDTWIRDGDTSAHGSDSQLYAGIYSTKNTWGLLRFSQNPYDYQHVTSATLKLYNTYTGSCTASGVGAYAISQTWNPSTTVWSTQPSIHWEDPKGFGWFAHGFSGTCPAASENIDVTDVVAKWGWHDWDNYGFLLNASDTQTSERKQFCSLDIGASPCNSSSNVPTLSVTYNSYPWPPQEAGVSPQASGTDGVNYVTSTTPVLRAKIGNSDGTVVKLEGEVSRDPAYPGEGSGVVWSGTGAAVAPLSMATVTVGTALQDGYHYRYRVRGTVVNGGGGTDTGPWSSYTTFKLDPTPPTDPTLSCASYPAGTWTVSAGSVSCTVDTAAANGAGYWWGIDEASPSTFIDDTSNTGAAKTFSINPAEGQHTLYARARDSALNTSAVTTYTFGVGKGGITAPKPNAQTQQSVGLVAQSQSGYTTFKYQYQAGTGGSTWTDIPFANLYAVGSGTPISAWPTGTVSGSVTNYPQLNWNVAATLTAAGKPEGAVQVRVVFNPSGTSWTSTGTTFVLAKTAFSGTAAQSSVGPGTVSLMTGDFAVDENDASAGGLSIGRTNTNLSPPAASSGPSGVFGAGWTTAAFGPDAGVGMYTLTDASSAGSVTLSDSSGTKAIYTGTPTTGVGVTFTGIGDAADGSTLVKSGSASPYTWTLTDADGTKTLWTQQGTTTTYDVSSVVETGTEGTTSYARDGSSRVTQIVGAPPTGVTCSTPLTTNGCRTLSVTYAGSTTATGTAEANWGDYTGLVSGISYTAWNPSTSAMATTAVASYLYDNTGHLRAEWDPRISPALKARYTYDGNGRLATKTDAGRATWTLTYDSSGRLSAASRPDPNTSTTSTTAVVYGLGLSGTGLPDVTSTTAATWNQTTDQAYAGAAVFPASHPPTGSAGSWTPTSTDWPYADLTYYDVNGRPVNTAQYGAGAWQIDSTRYDDTGHTIWSLSARNRAQALTPTADTDPYTSSRSTAAARADLLATINSYSAGGVDLLTTLGPAHPIYLAAGTYSSVRVKTSKTYDQGSPGGGTYHLVTTSTTSSVPLDGASTTAPDSKTTTNGYDPIDGASSTGDTSGWVHATPTVVTHVMGTSPGSSDITGKALLDSSGRVLESRMPESTSGDAGTTVKVYYTTAANGSYPSCGGHAEWAGLLCQTGPKAQPAGTTIPTTATTGYNLWDQPLTTVETSGSSTRTTTNGYDAAGRPTTIAISASPAADAGTAVPTTTTSYNSSTGDATSLTDGTNTISTVYNSIGQVTSYTDADGQASTSTYDIDGKLKTLNDGKGTYTFTYDGTDANGQTERRGALTSLDVGISGSPSTFTAAYDQDGNMTVQNYPGGIQKTKTYDNTGDVRTMKYAKSGTTWMQFGSGVDREGQTVWQGSPGSYQAFGYDNNARLTYVEDTANGACNTRAYTFSKDGNRTALATGAPAGDGSCQTSSTSTASSSYDAADRITNSGYTYDKFGRTLTAPSSDVSGGSSLTVGYYSNDMVASQAQGTKTKTFTLDPAMRIRGATDKTSGTETRRILNHYNNTDDTPAWINTSTNAGSSWTWQRNVTGIAGDLAILQDQTGTPQIQLTNPHGDVIATVDDTTAATSTNAYFESTEYGAPRTTNATNPLRYGWLGSTQRSGDDLAGLSLMGVRLYNPSTGRFLSVDPNMGGNENTYNYPNDPIDKADTTGRWPEWNAFGNAGRLHIILYGGSSGWYLRITISEVPFHFWHAQVGIYVVSRTGVWSRTLNWFGRSANTITWYGVYLRTRRSDNKFYVQVLAGIQGYWPWDIAYGKGWVSPI